MEPVQSSSIAAIGYERPHRLLLVQYRDSGETYVYFDVPPRVFAALQRAESKGRFVNAEIKGHYHYERLDAVDTSSRSRSARRRGRQVP
jgi:KTSC domain